VRLPPERTAQPGEELSPALLAELGRAMDLELKPQQCACLLAFVDLLQRWGRVHNLTAIEKDTAILSHHLLDCLAIVLPLERALARYAVPLASGQALRFLDAGSGAGLPGIALAIVRPAWHGTLVDAVQKKCAFLQQVRIELHLTNVSVHHARLERGGLGRHELIVARAFSSLRELVERTRDLLLPQGLWAAMKGRYPAAELSELPAGVEVLDTITLRVPRLREQRHLVLLRPTRASATGNP